MLVPPERLKEEVDDTVDHHAFQLQSWPALAEVDTRWRGSFGYLTAIVEKEGEDVRIPLCRIEYLGDDNARGFAMYLRATDAYTDVRHRRPRPPRRLPPVARSGTLNQQRTCDALH